MDQFTESEEIWRLTLQHSPVGMVLVSTEGRMLAVNAACSQMLGYDADVLRHMTFQEITHPDDLADDLELLQQTLDGTRQSYRITKRYLRADGSICWGDLSVTLLRNPDGSPRYFISQIVDVSAQRRAQAELTMTMTVLDRQHQMMEALFDAVDVGLALLDSEGTYLRWNLRHQRFLDLAFPEGHRGSSGQLGEVFAGDGIRRLTAPEMPSRRAAAGEEFDDLRIWIGSDPATRRALSVSARAVRDKDGTFHGAALSYNDVTVLMQALAVKDEFVASVSHELRTPLTMVLGHLELVGERPDLPPGVSEQLQITERNAKRLARVVADLLQVSEADSLLLHLGPADLAVVAREAVEAAQASASSQGLTLTLDAPIEVVCQADDHRLRQVADNLISNAIKYTEAGGSIDVLLKEDERFIELSVTDSGLGIDEGEVGDLFTRFFRGREAQARHIPGTGLGLNIVHAIATAHGGEVTCESTAGVGSTFAVRIPRQAALTFAE